MSEWARKRFWTEVEVTETEAGFAITLDGRPVRTPAKAALSLPSRRLAERVAAEWDAQGEIVDPRGMPFTRSANAAIDKVVPQRAEVVAMLAAYGDADLLCYRADAPDALVARQAAAWDPALDWAAVRFGARLVPRTGVVHVAQDADALGRLAEAVDGFDPFRLTALHDLVTLSGSLVLGLAAAEGWRDADMVWDLSRIDEHWQQEQWGHDDEAAEAAEIRRRSFQHAKMFHDLCQ